MPRDGQTSSALGKAITVLETFIDRTGPVSIGALAMWLGLPKQTVHRIVRQLVDEGLLERAPGSDRYTAGRRLRRLSERTMEQSLQTATPMACSATERRISCSSCEWCSGAYSWYNVASCWGGTHCRGVSRCLA